MIARLLASTALVLAMCSPASADPIITPLVTIGIGALLSIPTSGALVSAAGLTIGGISVVGLVTTVVEIGAITGVSLLLASKRRAPHDPRFPQPPTMQTMSPQSISPRYFSAGRVMVGGVIHWRECENTLHSLTGVILNCEPIDAVEAYIVDGENLTSVATGPFPLLSAYTNGGVLTVDCGPDVFWPTAGVKSQFMYTEIWDPSKNQWVQKPMGVLPAMVFDFRNGQAAGNPSLLAERFMASLYDVDHHKCANLACLYYMAVGGKVILARMGVYPRAWPEVATIIRGARIYDPRDPTQIFTDPSTWLWSRNSVLVLAWYMTHADGARIPYSKINWESVAEEADYCDRLVPKYPSGTEVFARTDIQWHTGEAVRDVMARLQAACDATVWEDGDGLWNIWIAKHVAPTVTLTDLDISSIVIEEGAAALEQINYLTPSYMEPRENYQMIQGAPVADATSIAAVGERPETINFKEVASFNQAHRLAWRAIKRANPAIRLTITGGPSLLRCIGEFAIGVESVATAISGTFRISGPASVSQNLEQVTLQLALVSPDDYDDAVPPYDPVSPYEIGIVPPPPPVPVQVPDAPSLAQVDISGDKYVNATATVGGATPSNPALIYYAEIREVHPTTHAPLGDWSLMSTAISQWVRQSGVVEASKTYEVHGWFILSSTPSAMSASSFITIT